MSERRPPLESLISHKIRPNLEENTHSLLTQKLCIFLYYNFNLCLQRGKPSIYRFRSLGRQEKKVEEE